MDDRFGWLVDRLLLLITDLASDGESPDTAEFRSDLNYYRDQITSSKSDESLEAETDKCLSVCQTHFRNARLYRREREAEISDLINVLRQALAELAGEAANFNTIIASSSERFERLEKIDDIRELKRQISEEVGDLKRVVTEKQRKEQTAYSKLTRRVEGLQTKLQEAREAATRDSLTSIANRGAFDDELFSRLSECAQSGKNLVLAMLDIDNFKNINDAHGHPIGDAVIASLAKILSTSVRPNDMVARYGGEEFAVLFDDSTLAQVEPRAHNLIIKAAGSGYVYKKAEESVRINFTVSCGIAQFAAGETPEDLLKRADEALYEAKRTGKNRVVAKTRPFWKTKAKQQK